MKKNLMSILILALLVVNIVLTAIMMFSVTGAMKSTTALVGRIAAVLDLELDLGTDDTQLSIQDSASYNITDAMTIPVKPGEDGEQHYVQIAVSIQMDKTHKDYKKYSETMLENESILKGEILEVVSSRSRTGLISNTFFHGSRICCIQTTKIFSMIIRSIRVKSLLFSSAPPSPPSIRSIIAYPKLGDKSIIILPGRGKKLPIPIITGVDNALKNSEKVIASELATLICTFLRR